MEDHRPLAQTTMTLLNYLGHEVHHAANGTEAIKLAIEINPEIMLIDIGLPDKSGYDVAKELRKLPQFKETTMIALTGYDCRDRAIQSGFTHYYKKPMDFTVLPLLSQ